MKVVRFHDPAGSIRTGRWVDDEIIVSGRSYRPEEVEILPPSEPSKIVCVGLNYIEHLKESGRKVPEDLPDRPKLFLKGPNALSAHEDTITLPIPDADTDGMEDLGDIACGEGRIDFEAELGVIIGEQCKDVSREKALDVVAGYTCANDVSNRDDQAAESNWVRGKAFDNSLPIGPVMATPDEVPENPRVQLWQNGEKKQDSDDDALVFSVPEVIEATTKFLTLEPGDVISMGTTYGVGPMADGDTIEIEVEGVGLLRHYVAEV